MRGRSSYSLTLSALLMSSIAYTLQQTMIVPALPALKSDLHTSYAWTTWVLTGFLLAASVGTPLLGKLGDQYGKDRLLMISLGIFLVGCIGAAAAWNIWSLIGFRMLQGAAGGIFPLCFAIIRDEFPPERIAGAIGGISAMFGVGAPLGLILSGLIVDHLSWRWIFVIGALPVVAALVMVYRFVPESPVKTPSRLDLPGAALLTGMLLCLLVPLTEASSWGWTSARTLGLFALSAILLAVWIVVELRVAEPLVDVRMLAQRTVALTNLTALIAGFSMYSTFVLLPNYVATAPNPPVDYGFGASATQTGLYLAPGSALMLFAASWAGALDRRFGSKWTLALGLGMMSTGMASLAAFNDHPWQIIVALLVLNPGVALAFAAMSTLMTRAVRATETGVANAMNAVLRTVGGVIGAQIAAAILASEVIRGTNVPTHGSYVTAWSMFAAAALIGVVVASLVTPAPHRSLEPVPAAD